MKILVADDDPVSRRLMQRMLELSGYQVTLACNGREASLELAKPAGPRLALIDWMMPELDGIGVCREVRARKDDSYIYILLLTSKETSEDVVKGLEAGADDYLTKPCHPAELKARLYTGRRILQLEDKLVEAREEMRYKATHDALTSLWDRGAILSLLRSELSRSTRDGTPVSLLLCDIDHFKRVNDGYGHQVGDEVLEEVSSRLLDSVRTYDAVGRYGGEEFLIVLGGCPRKNLQDRAEQMLSAINSVPFRTGQASLSITLSAGGITVEHWDRSVPVEMLLKQADQALYRAKAAGRNRVMYAETLDAEQIERFGEQSRSSPKALLAIK